MSLLQLLFCSESSSSKTHENKSWNFSRKSRIFLQAVKIFYLIILQNLPIKLGIGQFGCPFCPKMAKNSKDMKRHIMIHTGEKPFSCEFCEFRCNTSSNLYSHMRKFHGT